MSNGPNIARIPVAGTLGGGLAVIVLLTGLAIEVPGVRLALLGGVAGAAFAAGRIAWRQWTAPR